MPTLAEKEFGRLLTEGVHQIRLRLGKPVQVVQDELGYVLGRKGGSAIEYWRKGHIPFDIGDVEALAREIVRQGGMNAGWLEKFLSAAGHPAPYTLAAELFPHSPATPGRPAPRPRRYMPVELTPCIGREKDLTIICGRLLQPEVRLLTLTGPPGVGKTRLALQAGDEMQPAFDDRVFFVALAPIGQAELVPAAIGRALDVKEVPNQNWLDTLADALWDKHSLLVLDNFEQILNAALFVVDLLKACPKLKALVTSRSALHVRAEHQYPVEPLALPPDLANLPPPAELQNFAAIALFVERARAVKPDFELTAGNASAVAAICAHLNGLPLAIELIAARTKTMEPETLLARLDDCLSLLTDGPRDLPDRHRTLREAIRWGYNLLEPRERILFNRLGVFVDGWDLEAAEAVCADQSLTANTTAGIRLSAGEIFDSLGLLVNQSLVRYGQFPFSLRRPPQTTPAPETASETAGSEATRFGMLETIRAYALEQLEQSGEAEEIRRRHAAYYLQLAENAEPELRGGPRQDFWLRRLEAEHSNLRAAIQWGLTQPPPADTALRLTTALWRFWYVRNYTGEGEQWLTRALAGSKEWPPALHSRALNGAGSLAWVRGDYERAAQLYTQCLELCRQSGDTEGVIIALTNLGNVALPQGNYERAEQFYLEALNLCRQRGDKAGAAHILSNLSNLAIHQGNYARAAEVCRESLELQTELGERGNQLMRLAALINLSDASAHLGDLDAAGRLNAESLTLARNLGDRHKAAYALNNAVDLAFRRCQSRRAARLWGAAESLREAAGATLTAAERARFDTIIAAIRAELGEREFAAVFASGQALAFEDIIDYALQEKDY